MSFITYENAHLLEKRFTDEVATLLASSRSKQMYETIMMWNRKEGLPIPFLLIIELDKSYSGHHSAVTVYHREQHILGKAIRLLVEIEESDSFFKKMERFAIKSIMVTTATNPTLINDSNRWTLETEFARTTVRELLRIKRFDTRTFDTAIATLVRENSNRIHL